ncbi:MAG: hypothetical protein JSV01_06385 [Desulfobacterales bacterium]|nr:MAG: hypothetical protein JSV01_06385 [Desulfobacterales bacterium]
MKRRLLFSICLCFLTWWEQGVAHGVSDVIEEASGIVRLGEELLIVADETPGVYFRFRLGDEKGPAITIDPSRITKINLSGGTLALDLEAIDVLADGRIIVLSERLRSAVGEKGIVAEYDDPLSVFGNRGLEGLAVRRLGDGSSRIAVLWEGGYPEYKDVLKQLQRPVGRLPMRPVIWVHDLKPGQNPGAINAKRTYKVIELDVPKPAGQEPQAQRFRAPDLVWLRMGERDWGFIVLLSSENSPETGKTQYGHTWLQRFTVDGKPYGKPLDLKEMLPPYLQEANWEGLGWFEEGRSLVIIHDYPPRGHPTAYVIELFPSWRLP